AGSRRTAKLALKVTLDCACCVDTPRQGPKCSRNRVLPDAIGRLTHVAIECGSCEAALAAPSDMAPPRHYGGLDHAPDHGRSALWRRGGGRGLAGLRRRGAGRLRRVRRFRLLDHRSHRLDRPDPVGRLPLRRGRPAPDLGHRRGSEPQDGERDGHPVHLVRRRRDGRVLDLDVRLPARDLERKDLPVTSYATDKRRLEGTGSAHHGAGTWIKERVSSLILIPLTGWGFWAAATLSGGGFDGLTRWLHSPVNATLLAVTILVSLYHM